jgi:hypothetical protein
MHYFIQIVFSWVITLCLKVVLGRSEERAAHPEDVAACTYETFATTYWTTRNRNPEDSNPDLPRDENFISSTSCSLQHGSANA